MTATHDRGFTLVELLVAITMLAIITGALTAALVVTLRTTDDASSRLGRAHDIQISTAFFASDVQSSDAVLAGAAPTPCGTSAALSFMWTDPGADGVSVVDNVVSYRRDDNRLVRRHCQSGAVSRTRENVVSHFLADQPLGAPRCDDVSCPTGATAPLEVAWELEDGEGDRHTLRGTRRVTS